MSFITKFRRSLSFTTPDPLGGGLAEAIAAEQAEAEAITLEEVPDTVGLIEQWDRVVEDIEHDPEWFSFASDED